MYVNFSEQLAIDFDLEVEYFLRNLVGWIGSNAAKDSPDHRNFHEGHYWSFNSYPEYAKLIPVFSKKQIRTVTARAIKGELLKVSNFNRKKYDNTNWYTLTEKGWTYFEREAKKIYADWFVDSNKADEELTTPAQTGRPPAQTGRPIPLKANSLSSINTNTTTGSSKQKPTELMRELIEVYREEFPNNPQPHKTLLSTSLEKVLRGLIKRWPEADPCKRPINPESFRQYMKALKSLSPQFALGEYETKNGRKKKNGLETFCRWDNFVKFLENQYS